MIPVLYEDNHLLVVEKPVNVPTQADNSSDPDLLSMLKEYIRERYNKPGNVYLGLVHRLDRPVGGVMVFARTSKAASRLSDQIRKGELHKEYLAVVHGLAPDSGHLENYLWKDEKNNIVHIVDHRESSFPNAKLAILDYETLGRTESHSLVKVKLVTGRSHQIRVQMMGAGHPLYGDQKYGANLNRPGQQIALWSAVLRFKHPTLNEWMEFKSLPPHVIPWSWFSVFP